MFENDFNNMARVVRNDAVLASGLDYAEQTSWLLFLEFAIARVASRWGKVAG